MVGSTFRLLPAAKVMAKFLPLDTISLRYVAWEILVEVRNVLYHCGMQQHCICKPPACIVCPMHAPVPYSIVLAIFSESQLHSVHVL